MRTFGNCAPPINKEYYNMDFMISHGEGVNFYQGQTIVKRNPDTVSINYGFKYNNLELHNFLNIDITKNPIVLEANYSFKGIINRILEIWKTSPAKDIDTLWSVLENNEFFLSILQVGSQKAIGDIFQEINSTLENGGYANPITGFGTKNTFGLMGDRPSGIRVIQLLRYGVTDVNDKACGGYISNNGSLIYSKISIPKKRKLQNSEGPKGKKLKGGMTQKKIKSKTNTRKKNKKSNKRRSSIKKAKKNNRNTRRFGN
jgi:hypothetical protein